MIWLGTQASIGKNIEETDLLLPNNIGGSLDAIVNNILGCDRHWLGIKILFLYHIIFSFCDPTHPNVTGDKWMP